MIFFWNVLAPYSGNNLSHVESNDMRNPMSLLVKVQPQNVTIPRPVHQIHLTETGQLYACVIGPTHTTFVDNAGIMTYYGVQHLTNEEFAIAEEKERIQKEQEAIEKRAEAERQQKIAAEQEEQKQQKQSQNSSRQGNSRQQRNRGQPDPYAPKNDEREADVDFDDRRERQRGEVPNSSQIPSRGHHGPRR